MDLQGETDGGNCDYSPETHLGCFRKIGVEDILEVAFSQIKCANLFSVHKIIISFEKTKCC